MKPSLIIVHDRFVIRGGGERLILTLAEHAADALCFAVRSADGFDPTELKDVTIYDLNAVSRFFGLRTYKLIHAFARRATCVQDYDIALYSGILAPLAARLRPDRPNVMYCHTPPRLAYDKFLFHLQNMSWLKKPFFLLYAPYLRRLFQSAAERMDLIVSNSETVRRRTQHYLGLDSEVVHPPCDTAAFHYLGQEDYYVSTARMDPLKRVDVIIQAFKRMPDKKLVVLSGGAELESMQALARGCENIRFTGWVEDAEMKRIIGKAIATVYIPQDEDFGMSPPESMAAGKPVLGVAEGGLTETVVHGETGILLPPDPGPDDVVAGIQELTPQRAKEMRSACESRAELFDTRIFLEKMDAIFKKLS